MSDRDEKGRWKPGNSKKFREGPDPRRNPNGKPKGAQLSSAYLRALAKPLRKKRGGYSRIVADEIADEIVRRARDRLAQDAVRAATELRKATEGQTIKLADAGGEDLKAVPLEDLLTLRAALMQRRAKPEEDEADSDSSTSTRKP